MTPLPTRRFFIPVLLIMAVVLFFLLTSRKGNKSNLVHHRSGPIPTNVQLVILFEPKGKSTPLVSFTSCPTRIIDVHAFVDSDVTEQNLFNILQHRCDNIRLRTYHSDVLKSYGLKSVHYSSSTANRKLGLIEYFRGNLSAFLYMDTDTFALYGFDDLYNLWQDLENFNEAQWIGCARELVNLNIVNYNTGVMLVDLTKPYANTSWPNELNRGLEKVHFETVLADQDVFNAIFESNPDWMYTLGCHWNMQFTAGHQKKCPSPCWHVIHYNQPGKKNYSWFHEKAMAQNNKKECRPQMTDFKWYNP